MLIFRYCNYGAIFLFLLEACYTYLRGGITQICACCDLLSCQFGQTIKQRRIERNVVIISARMWGTVRVGSMPNLMLVYDFMIQGKS